MKREQRQEILDAYIRDHGDENLRRVGGEFDAQHFIECVQNDPKHPARDYFMPPGWEAKARDGWLLNRLIRFKEGLTIEVMVDKGSGPELVRTPFVMADRDAPVGTETRYRVAGIDSRQPELGFRMAHKDLRSWLEKYGEHCLSERDTAIIKNLLARIESRRLKADLQPA